MKVQVNRRDKIEIDNIERIEKGEEDARIYQKHGYPKILKTNCSYDIFLLRLINAGVRSDKLKYLINPK